MTSATHSQRLACRAELLRGVIAPALDMAGAAHRLALGSAQTTWFRGNMRALILIGLVASVTAGCFTQTITPGFDSGNRDAGTDAVTSDGGSDARPPSDAGLDTNARDSGTIDAGPDATIDLGTFDSARPDAGMCMDPRPEPSRRVAWECSSCRPPGPGPITGGVCDTDADCTDASIGTNGRCVYARIGGVCSYDECFTDSDCELTELCACDGASGGGNTCLSSNCRVDSDCGAYTCAPTLGGCGHYTPPVAYYCHTATDSCYSDADCAGAGLRGYCAYNGSTGSWACSTSECAG